MSKGQPATDFSGTWHSVYYYTSSAAPGMFVSEYDVKIHHKDGHLIIESQPSKEESYILLRLSLEGRIATGTWEEHTSPSGSYKGVIYHGALQLVLAEDGQALHGMYIGFDRRMEVRSGHWEIVRE